QIEARVSVRAAKGHGEKRFLLEPQPFHVDTFEEPADESVFQHLAVKDVNSDLHGLVAADAVIERNILKLEIVTLLCDGTVRSPIDLAVHLLQQRHMFGALAVSFL